MENFAVLLLNDSFHNGTDPYGTRDTSISYFVWLHVLTISVVLFCGVFGNLFILVCTANTQWLRNHTGASLINLTIADFSVVVTTLPFMINVAVSDWEWRHDRFLCEVIGFAENVFTTASTLTTALISYERYLAIVKSFDSQMNTKRTTLLIMLVWMTAFFNGTLPITQGSGYGFNPVTHTCTVSWHAISFEFTCVLQTLRFFAPLAILTYSYGKIILVAKKAQKQVSPAVASGNQQPARSGSTDDTSLDEGLASQSQTSVSSSANEKSTQSCSANSAATVPKNSLGAKQQRKTSSTVGYKTNSDQNVAPTAPVVQKLNASQNQSGPSSACQDSYRASYNMVSALSGMSQQQTQCSNDNPSLLLQQKMNILRRRKASSTLFILVAMFLISWLPYILLTFKIQTKNYSRGNLSTTVVLLALANSSINVFLYGLTNTKYRREVQNWLQSCLSLNRLKTRINVQINEIHVATISKSMAQSRKESRTKYISHGEIPLGSHLTYSGPGSKNLHPPRKER